MLHSFTYLLLFIILLSMLCNIYLILLNQIPYIFFSSFSLRTFFSLYFLCYTYWWVNSRLLSFIHLFFFLYFSSCLFCNVIPSISSYSSPSSPPSPPHHTHSFSSLHRPTLSLIQPSSPLPAQFPEEPSAKLQTEVEGVSHAGTIPHSFERLAWAAPSPVAPFFFFFFWHLISYYSCSLRQCLCLKLNVVIVCLRRLPREVLLVLGVSFACLNFWLVPFRMLP